MSFWDTFADMFVILVAMATGYAGNKLGYLSEEVDRKLTKFLLNLLMPMKILSAVSTSGDLPERSVVLSVLAVAVAFYVFGLVMAVIIPAFLPLQPGQKGVWRYILTFPNVGFIGYSVAVAMFGQGALIYAVLLVMPFNLLNYSLGPLMLTGAKRFDWHCLLTPCIVASLVSLIMALTAFKLPVLVTDCLLSAGQMALPMSQVLVGSMLATLPVKKMFDSFSVWVLAAVRLLAMPLIFLPVARFVGAEDLVFDLAITQMAMPAALNGTLLCMEYGGDAEYMAKITFLSILASTVTLPIVAAVLL